MGYDTASDRPVFSGDREQIIFALIPIPGDIAVQDNLAFSLVSKGHILDVHVRYTSLSYRSSAVIYNEGTVTITDSNFSDNTATSGGGSIYNKGDLTIKAISEDVTFSNNKAGGD